VNWFDPEAILTTLGTFAVFGVAAIIFLETATIFGSFLPGDSLLFLLGLFLATSLHNFPIVLAEPIVLIAAVVGSEVGYWVGKKVGPTLFERKPTFFFNPKVLARTKAFYAEYGSRAIILARFVPILRALVPMTVGMAGYNWRRYLVLNIIGGAAWVITLMTLGYLLGNVTFVREHIEAFVLGFVVLSSLPFPIELLRNYLKKRRAAKRVAEEWTQPATEEPDAR
jgi:membrane-associated protein